MIKTKKQLALRTETVVALTTESLRSVQGGRTVYKPRGSQCSYDQSGCIQEPDK